MRPLPHKKTVQINLPLPVKENRCRTKLHLHRGERHLVGSGLYDIWSERSIVKIL